MFEDTFEENGRMGLRSAEGDILVPAIYDDLIYNNNPFQPLPARQNGFWGLILPDGKGTPISKFEFDNMFYVNRLNIFRVFLNGKKNFLTEQGELVFPCWIDAMNIWEDFDYMSLIVGDKVGFYFFSTGYFIPAEYDEVRTARGTEDGDGTVYIRQGDGIFRINECEQRVEPLTDLAPWHDLAPDEDICPVDCPVDFC